MTVSELDSDLDAPLCTPLMAPNPVETAVLVCMQTCVVLETATRLHDLCTDSSNRTHLTGPGLRVPVNQLLRCTPLAFPRPHSLLAMTAMIL